MTSGTHFLHFMTAVGHLSEQHFINPILRILLARLQLRLVLVDIRNGSDTLFRCVVDTLLIHFSHCATKKSGAAELERLRLFKCLRGARLFFASSLGNKVSGSAVIARGCGYDNPVTVRELGIGFVSSISPKNSKSALH